MNRINKTNQRKSRKLSFKKYSLNEFILLLIKWLAKCTNCTYKETTYALRVVDKIFRIKDSRGIAEAIRYTKDLRLKFMKAILSIDPIDFRRRDQLWLPKLLVPIIEYIEASRSYPFIRLIFSALYITRSYRLKGEISTDTIEAGPTYSGTPESLDPEIKSFLKDLGVNLKHIGKPSKKLIFKEFHMTSKSGPNGHALWDWFKDLGSLTPNQIASIKVLGGQRLTDLMFKASNLYHNIPNFFNRYSKPITGNLVSRKLAKILDKEGKIREVAIGDYYSQAALLPLHNYLYKILNRIHQDCTSDQTKLFYSLEHTGKENYHSIDLKAFTDRFPIDINHRIFTVWFGKEYADAWKCLMVEQPFVYQGRNVSYGTGNPMGLYSSFNSTALAHHFLVWKACKRSKIRWKRSRYMLLGDDIVIANDTLANNYKRILSEWGIEIQYSKTHISPNGFEFAKQIRLHGINVSPFPLSALYERRNQSLQALGILVQEFAYKRWDSDLMSAIERYYIQVLQWPRPKYKAFKPTLELVISLLKYLQGDGLLGKAITRYVKATLPVKKVKWPNKAHRRLFVHWVAVQVVQQLYIDSRERIVSRNTKGSLGDLATEMVMHITSLRDGGADCFDLIESIPFLQVYGRAEELYLKSFDNLYDYGMGSSEKMLRTHIGKVDIPLSDEGFYVRHRDVLIVQSMKASRIITKLLKTTTEVVAYNGSLRFTVPWAKAIEPQS